MGITIQKFTFNAFQENTYILHDNNCCVIIDPGCYDQQEKNQLLDYVNSNGLKPIALLHTHSHIDHVLGSQFVLDTFDIDFYTHQIDVETLDSVESYAHLYGFPGYNPPRMPNKLLKGGEVLTFGNIELNVLYTPGHAPGHVVYYNSNEKFVINGDVLFAGSFGRVDLPGGNLETLKHSIHTIMFELPEETTVFCGHGPETTIGKEKRSNYILNF